ncbi:MAG: aminopeptidase [Proteobacteria bacterium]|nr:aminopeptidase [Pseudomonadota bacterium]
MERPNAWKNYNDADKKAVFQFAEAYREFLSKCKTERECVTELKKKAMDAGFIDMKEIIEKGTKLKAGDRVFADNHGKNLALYIIGTDDLECGMNILGAHIDSPRLDLKQNPLYEDTEMALLDTHYYGGIKKYQWVTVPLAIHGVVAKKDGTQIHVSIGEAPSDPVFGVSDLLIHLSADLMNKKASEVVEGEALDVLVGNMPLLTNDEDDKKTKDAVKANILLILKEQYDFDEEDFLSAELEVVPAGPARDYGFDRSMIMGYGHDDRSCAYPSFAAMLEIDTPKKTAVCLLVDKEEIGSVGPTGMRSRFFENMTAEVMHACGNYSELRLRRALQNSKVLSSDVSAAFDPNYPSVTEKKNAAYFGHGIVFNKYTGARGKSGSNDANAEYVAEVRKIMDDNGVFFQTAELGKVDVGGGGTIAYILGNYNMQVIDCGVAVLNMHAPWEIISKADLYEAKKGYIAFLNHA